MDNRMTMQKTAYSRQEDVSTPAAYYRLAGLDCADCARKFQGRIGSLPGVIYAQVFFASGRMKVVGDVSLEVLQAAGRQEGIDVFAGMEMETAGFFRENKTGWFTAIASGVALSMGWVLSLFYLPGVTGLYTIAILVGGFATFRKGIGNLFRLRFDMSVLMTVAVVGAVLIGQWTEGATVAFLFSVSELLESYTADRARRSLRGLMDMSPKFALVLKNGVEVKVPVAEVLVGDEVLIRPGEGIPVDGIVLEGFSGVDEAPITGESVPVSKSGGSEVFAGTINQTGALRVRVGKETGETTLAKIIQLVEEAQNKKVGVQSFIDRFAAYYTPAVMVLAALIVLIPPLVFGFDWQPWIYRGLALLVVACPCALVITTPVVVVSAIGNAAKNGVLIKGGSHLERLAAVNIIAFDKTGTLTKGLPKVSRVVAYDGEESEVLSLAAAVERLSEHPLASAILRAAEKQESELKDALDFRILPGKGAEAWIGGERIRVGNRLMFSKIPGQTVVNDMDILEKGGHTVVLVGKEERIIGLIAMADQVREEAFTALHSLRDLKGIKTVMLTGDSPAAAAAVAEQVGVDGIYARMLPQDKVDKINGLKGSCDVVMMVGDGINDAPALAAADVSVAMGAAGTDVALEAADIALMSDNLEKIAFAVELGRQSLRVIKQNITFALVIKVLAILAVFPGWLTLWIAIIADMGANVLVTLNGMRLVRYRHELRAPRAPDKEAACACT